MKFADCAGVELLFVLYNQKEFFSAAVNANGCCTLFLLHTTSKIVQFIDSGSKPIRQSTRLKEISNHNAAASI